MTKRLFEYPVSFFTFFSSYFENHRAYLFSKLPLRIVVVAYGTLSSHRNDNFLSPNSIVTISGYTEYYAIILLLPVGAAAAADFRESIDPENIDESQ